MRSTLRWTCAIAAAGLVLAGCGSSGETAAGGSGANKAGKTITVDLLPKQKGSPYFTSCYEGAKEAEKELGNVNLVYDGPTDGKPETAATKIDQWQLKGTDVIAVSVVDRNAEGPAMKKARAAGVKVITWDADADPDSRDFFVNQATAKEIGYALVDAMAKDLGGDKASGEVAIISADSTAANQNEWMKYMTERLAKYPGLKNVATKFAGEDSKKSHDFAMDLMNAYPNLKGIFAISSVAFPNSAAAVEQAGKVGKVLVTGLGLPDDMVDHVTAGSVKSVILWNTKDLGYLTVYAARALADGTLKPGSTSLKAGRLGEVKVEGDNILLGGIMVFDKGNIDKYVTKKDKK